MAAENAAPKCLVCGGDRAGGSRGCSCDDGGTWTVPADGLLEAAAKDVKQSLTSADSGTAAKTRSEDITWTAVLAEYHPWAVCSHKGEKLLREILERLEALEAERDA